MTTGPPDGERRVASSQPVLRRTMLADALLDADERVRIGLPRGEDQPMDVVIELNLGHARALPGAEQALRALLQAQGLPEPGTRVSDVYVTLRLSLDRIRALVTADLAQPAPERAVYRVWPDFPVRPLIDASATTVKADAARRSYAATGRGVVWAVVDSGIARHPHFTTYGTLDGDVAELHRDFTVDPAVSPGGALTDGFGDGTHVAGIIAGALPRDAPAGWHVMQRVQDALDPDVEKVEERTLEDASLLSGVAPQTRLVSLKVLDDQGRGSAMTVARALEYVRREVNGQSKVLRIHGVNLSVATSSTPSGSPAGRARCAPRSTGWCAPASWSSSPPATPATARCPRSSGRPRSA